MGLLKHLLFWPVTGPMFLAEFSLDKLGDVAREELTDDNAVKAELYELQLKLELGDIDEERYAAEERRLMQRLREVREWREYYGMGVSGGVVRVADAAGDAGERASPGPIVEAAGDAGAVPDPDSRRGDDGADRAVPPGPGDRPESGP